MATQYITLADGRRLQVEGTRDYDAGTDYDYEGALNNAGYVSVPGAGTLDFFRSSGQGDFSSPEQYLQWLYGGGSLANTSAGQYFQTPNGVDSTVNQPLDYNPEDPASLKLMRAGLLSAWALPAMEFAGFTEFGGAGNVLDAPWGVNPQFTPGIEDFYGSLAENAGIGTTTTNALTSSAATPWGVNPMTPMNTGLSNLLSSGVPTYTPPVNLPNTTPGPLSIPSTFPGFPGDESILPDWLKGAGLSKIIGALAPSVLGAYSADKQADANKEMQERYLGMGQPYRDLLLQSYQPGFDLNNEPGFKNSMDTGLNTWLRAASAGNAQGVASGNPLDSPGAAMEAQKYVTGSLAMPYMTNYRRGLSLAGQLGIGPSADFGAGEIKAQGERYEDVGMGLRGLLNPTPDYTKQFLDLYKYDLDTRGKRLV